MKFIAICTEGDNSEPSGVQGAVGFFRSQAPNIYKKLEIVPIGLGGNQGYEHLVEKAEQCVNEELIAPGFIDQDKDELEKLLVCDYDDIEKSHITIDELRAKAKNFGYKIFISRPNFEYFVARLFFTEQELSLVEDLEEKINEGIREYNAGRPVEFQVPQYSKKKFVARDCLSGLFNYDPTFVGRACSIGVDSSKDRYTELPELFCYLRELFLPQE